MQINGSKNYESQRSISHPKRKEQIHRKEKSSTEGQNLNSFNRFLYEKNKIPNGTTVLYTALCTLFFKYKRSSSD